MKVNEHDCVVLTADLPSESLKAGDVGTVVHVHKNGEAYEVEFTTLDGHTLAVATVGANQLRPVSGRDVTHVRQLEAA
jgi:hypothetical protein